MNLIKITKSLMALILASSVGTWMPLTLATNDDSTSTTVEEDDNNHEDEGMTYEQAQEEAARLAPAMAEELLSQQYITQDQIDQLPSDAITLALIPQLMATKTTNVSDTYNILLSKYPDILTQAPEPMTEEEAQRYIEENNLVQATRQYIIDNQLMTEDQLNQLTDEMIYDALLEQFTTHEVAGDFGQTVEIIKQHHPGIFESTSTGTVSSSGLSHSQSLEWNQLVQLGNREYMIRRVFLLESGEAGNHHPNNDWVGITIEYTNDGTEEDQDYYREWITQAIMVQDSELGYNALTMTEYSNSEIERSVRIEETTEEAQADMPLHQVKPGETVVETIYYELKTQEDDLALFIVANDTQYEIAMETLKQMPPQSAIYYSDQDRLVAYLFDFDQLYLIYSDQARLSDINQIPGQSEEVQHQYLSDEAWSQFQLLSDQVDLNHVQLYVLENITYELSGDMIGVRQIESRGTPREESLTELLLTFRLNEDRSILTNEYREAYRRP